jgi:putative tryptophan/tyrosine transport system substrate-binding protein
MRSVLASVALSVTLAPAPVHSAQPAAVHRIAVLSSALKNVEEGLRDNLRELGYREGGNIIIEWRPSLGTEEELRSLASQLVRAKVELIVAFSTPAARAALQATTLPVVFALGDPWAPGWLKAWRTLAARERECRCSIASWWASVWSSSNKSHRAPGAWAF